jgi:hypothetical protein
MYSAQQIADGIKHTTHVLTMASVSNPKIHTLARFCGTALCKEFSTQTPTVYPMIDNKRTISFTRRLCLRMPTTFSRSTSLGLGDCIAKMFKIVNTRVPLLSFTPS